MKTKKAAYKTVSSKIVTDSETKKKSDAILKTNREEEIWQRTFAITEHWLSDLQFFKDEFSFFKKLLTQRLMWLTDDDSSNSLRVLSSKIINLESKRTLLEQEMIGHLKLLSNRMTKPLSHDSQKRKSDHAFLETSFADFVKEFRKIKKEAFEQIEKVMDTEKEKADAIM